jgi:hypothetical protein
LLHKLLLWKLLTRVNLLRHAWLLVYRHGIGRCVLPRSGL